MALQFHASLFNFFPLKERGGIKKEKAMSKLAKILVTVGVLCVFFLLFAAIVGVREASGHESPGIFGLILFMALLGAIRAIWKSGKKNSNDNNNSSVLQ